MMNLNRRSLLTALSATGLFPLVGGSGLAQQKAAASVKFGPAKPFSYKGLLDIGRRTAAASYRSATKIPQDWIDLEYTEYRGINFQPDSAVWKNTARPFEMEFFAPGLYFPAPITVSVIENNQARQALFSKDVFRFNDAVPELSDGPTLGYSGLRLRANINDPDRKDEFVVFQGASYFRAVARGQAYGLSARGLALRTGEAEGEEFPDFRHFWVEAPHPGAKSIRVHALMDSPSVVGIYSFDITPGNETQMAVEATLFPRVDLTHVGIAAETSMFLFDETNRNRFDDFRQAVHDSDGLLIQNGAGETLWRHLSNPVELQVSSFVDNGPRGFGLMQRPRKFADYADLEANYHRRPGLWVIPGEDWGRGSVTLVEIPADKEIYDNIVAYWRPRQPLEAGKEHRFTYRLFWCDEAPISKKLARVINTRTGKRALGEKGRIASIDFAPSTMLPDDLNEVAVHVSSTGGSVSPGILQRNPSTGGPRLSFTFDPGDRKAMEMRAQLVVNGKTASEVWLYRWTA